MQEGIKEFISDVHSIFMDAYHFSQNITPEKAYILRAICANTFALGHFFRHINEGIRVFSDGNYGRENLCETFLREVVKGLLSDDPGYVFQFGRRMRGIFIEALEKSGIPGYQLCYRTQVFCEEFYERDLSRFNFKD